LRQAGFVEISLVAQVDGEIVGHILFSRAFRGGSNIRHRSETAFEMVGIDGPRRGAADEP
ncbi:MAG: hypothetical protein KY475_23465, partial [Planctomycetes bacterium]|nr:hypothetical protein [Planctomycetota bacterium]